MVEKTKRLKKDFISEEDMSTLLQSYTATAVLTLLQEVAQVEDWKIDWNTMVKKTSTGITNAREYQMLWRHLAYRHGLFDKLNEGSVPLDDDSDLEYELDAFPVVSSEASAEAAACVKVLIASGIPSDPNGSTVEAPLTINIPNGQPSRIPDNNSHFSTLHGTNITVPVSVQKQPTTVTRTEVLENHGSISGNLPPRRKRKPWSHEEDMELIAAVQKCGEGNWANILKGDFKGDRTASQLSQRWAIIRKRPGNSNVGTGSQLSEAQLATRRAVSIALGDNLKAPCSIGANSNTLSNKPVQPPAMDTSSAAEQSQGQSHHETACKAVQQSSKYGTASKKPLTNSTISPDSMLKAAAVAAGARIVTSDAASLLKAKQSKNVVHIVPGGSSLIKSSATGNTNALPSNVHFIRTGLSVKSLSSRAVAPPTSSRPGGTPAAQSHPVKSSPETSQHVICNSSVGLNASNVTANANTADVEVKTVENTVKPTSGNMLEDPLQEKVLPALSNGQVKGDHRNINTPFGLVSEGLADFSGNESNDKVKEDQTSCKLNAQVGSCGASGLPGAVNGDNATDASLDRSSMAGSNRHATTTNQVTVEEEENKKDESSLMVVDGIAKENE